MRLQPFFSYYGSKWNLAHLYPSPDLQARVIEPFAGSACYSLLYHWKDIELYDLDPVICSLWQYLIKVSESEILGLPDLLPGQTTEDLTIAEEAKYLIGFWNNPASSSPKPSRSSWSVSANSLGKNFWGEKIRKRIAVQLHRIRHWKITNADYGTIEDQKATWFIDPPYQVKGHYYRFSSNLIDFKSLGEWSKARTGTVIVCEQTGADWLNFRPLQHVNGQKGKSVDAVWSNNEPQLSLFQPLIMPGKK